MGKTRVKRLNGFDLNIFSNCIFRFDKQTFIYIFVFISIINGTFNTMHVIHSMMKYLTAIRHIIRDFIHPRVFCLIFIYFGSEREYTAIFGETFWKVFFFSLLYVSVGLTRKAFVFPVSLLKWPLR